MSKRSPVPRPAPGGASHAAASADTASAHAAAGHPLPIALPAIVALLFGLVAGLWRLPWEIGFAASTAPLHGPLMVAGFLGTVIGVERAAALSRPWAWLAPAVTGLGALLMLVVSALPPTLPFRAEQAAGLLFALGALGLCGIFLAVLRRQPTLFNAVMGLGALAFLAANLALAAGKPVAAAVPGWNAFLLLTIAGERLELGRVLAPKRGTGPLFVALSLVALAGAVAAPFALRGADRLLGFAMLVFGLWLATNDVARRTVRLAGVTRYTAICLLAGYVWLVIAGFSYLAKPGEMVGPYFDATLHAFAVGFVLSMIFGHAPIIVPALTGRAVRFSGHFYLPLALLHASLLMRIAGDHAGALAVRRWGGLLNEVALLLFAVVLVAAVRRGARRST
jgi:hypothetical protein